MADLLESLGAWFNFFLSLIVRPEGEPTKYDIVHGLFQPSASTTGNAAKAILLVFVVAPVCVGAAVGLYRRFIRKD